MEKKSMKKLNYLAMALCLAFAACCSTACTDESNNSENSESLKSEVSEIPDVDSSVQVKNMPVQESSADTSTLLRKNSDTTSCQSVFVDESSFNAETDTSTAQFFNRYSDDDNYYLNVDFVATGDSLKESQTITIAHHDNETMYYFQQSDESFGMIESDEHVYALYPENGVYYESSIDAVGRDIDLSLEQMIDSLMSDAVFVESKDGYDIYKFDSDFIYDMFKSEHTDDSTKPNSLYFCPDGNKMKIEARTNDGKTLDNVINITLCDFDKGDVSMFDLSKYEAASVSGSE